MSFETSVRDFETPITNSLGRICWVPVDTSGAPAIRTATYTAKATYDTDALPLTDRVRLRLLGRAEAPEEECTACDEATDVVLSDPFELERRVTQAIEIGSGAHGADLAALVGRGTFCLGASAEGNVALDEVVRFEDGRISVGL